MSEETKHEIPRQRLGRGLAALIGDAGDESQAIEHARGQKRIPIEFLRPNARNPRKNFPDEELDDLTNSIRERGIIQPILARTLPNIADVFEIIAGERRWRAAQRAGLHEVPVILVEAGDRDALEIAIIENVQRADLNPIEEAMGYEQLGAEFGYGQTELARVIGKSRSHIANTMRLLKLPDAARLRVMQGEISAGHARALLAVADPESVAERIVAQGLNVRDVERIAQQEASEAAALENTPVKSRKTKDADTLALEKALADQLGLMVSVDHRPNGGEIRIRYKTLEQLDSLCRRLQG